jgi:hypothetical protein
LPRLKAGRWPRPSILRTSAEAGCVVDPARPSSPVTLTGDEDEVSGQRFDPFEPQTGLELDWSHSDLSPISDASFYI